ncbi:MAG: glycerate kinase [Candidatus Aminicenantes bacterium]|nr:glycerate kinase [Candidatus Aminicenantes bacterium]
MTGGKSIRLERILELVYRAALAAVDPGQTVRDSLFLDDEVLRVGDRAYPLREFRKIFLAGAGKAAVPMAGAVEQILGDRLNSGLVVVKYGHGGVLDRTRVLEAGHPEPDENGVAATSRILEFLDRNLTSQDLLLVLISGGGSALTPCPVPGITLSDKQAATSVLLNSGATIHEINAIRKHLSRFKGGRLLRHTHGAQVVSLLLSDVVGDDVSSIASGPTVPDPTRFEDCLGILTQYGIRTAVPDPVLQYLQEGAAGGVDAPRETPKENDPAFVKVQNRVVGSNILALKAAADESRRLGFAPLILSSSVYGNTEDVAKVHVGIAREVLQSGHPVAPPCCIISGGETTVRVTGSGKGGRNQEFALWCAREMESWGNEPLLIASIGSDGNDGPTDAAGAWATPETARRSRSLGLDPDSYLGDNDSYHFFEKLGDLIITGPTQTNVMDLRFILVGS